MEKIVKPIVKRRVIPKEIIHVIKQQAKRFAISIGLVRIAVFFGWRKVMMIIIIATRQQAKRFVIMIGMEITVQHTVKRKMMAQDTICAIQQQGQRFVSQTGMVSIAQGTVENRMIQMDIILARNRTD